MNRMPLNIFFGRIQNKGYCLVKSYAVIDYPEGCDLDIFCFNVEEMIEEITDVGKIYVQECGYEIQIAEVKEKHVQVDFCDKGKIIVRFDLYGVMPRYKRVRVKPSFFSSVIENAEIIIQDFDGEKIPIKVASEQDDMILRYIEYVEYFMIRPDKVKHLDYILEKIEQTPSKIQYIDRLHYYTDFPNYEVILENPQDERLLKEGLDKDNRKLLREYQSKLDASEERYKRLLAVAETDYKKIAIPPRIIIYGAGKVSKVLYKNIKDRCSVECFLDMYSQEKSYEGIPIIAPCEVVDKEDKVILVVPMFDYESIADMLMRLYGSNTILISLDDFLNNK